MSTDEVAADASYPVLFEQALGEPIRKLFRGARRDLSELPAQPPGTVYVFETEGRYQTMPRQRLSGAEPVVLRSMSVSLVSTRARVIQVEIRLPSASPADDFTMQVGFRCQVARPEIVAGAGLRDISGHLTTYLTGDLTLAAKCAAYEIDDIADVRDIATTQITAYCNVRPPRVDGMTIALHQVNVYTPQDLRDYTKTTRDTKWKHAVDDLRRMGEREAVDYLTTMLNTPEGARALAVQRGDLDTKAAAEQVTASRSEETRATLDLIRVMADNDYLDRVPLDIKYLFDSAVEALTGRRAAVQEPGSDRTAPPKGISVGESDREADTRFIADEDDLAD
jgi:hypothetical protein